jgi:hypothetical protein
MQEPSLFKIFTDRLNKLGAPYMITGSVASIIYGEPRLTHDIDIVITLSITLIEKFRELFPLNEFYFPPDEVLKNEILRDNRGHCNIIHHHSGFKADIYFTGNDDFLHWALSHVKSIDFFGDKIPIAPIEYVIIKKLEFYKEGNAQKHLKDISAMLLISKDLLNEKILMDYIVAFGLEREWKLCSEF